MRTKLSMTRLLSLGLCAAALAACNNDDGTTQGETGNTEGASSSGTTADVSATQTTPSSNSDPVTDTNESSGGMSGASMTTPTTTDTAGTDSSTTDATATATDSSTTAVSATDSSTGTTAVSASDTGTGTTGTTGTTGVEPGCGNGIVEDPEVCDDGNQVDGDGCEADCTITPAVCGNGVVEMGEACDDGNQVNGGPGDFCLNNCVVFQPASCNAPAAKDYIVCDKDLEKAAKADKTIAHKAMGICNDQPANSVKISNYTFTAADNNSWQVAKGFGTYTFDDDMDPITPPALLYKPREGETFLMVSTGVIKAPNAQGIVIENNGSQGGNGPNGNDDTNALPPPMQSTKGSGGVPFTKCDGMNDCSDTLEDQWALGNSDPNDKLWFTFKTKVPEGTFGYKFDFVFCSAEWPTWVDTGFNDLLIAWQSDPTKADPNANPPIDPYTGNVTFIPDPGDPKKGLPLTITALDPYFLGDGFSGNEPQLAGTGFNGNACSNWFTAKGGVQPGADVTIGFFIADMSDTALATMAILDNFRWDCEGCVPSEVDDCGVQEPQ